MLDWYPPEEPQPHHFDEQHSAFICLTIGETEVDVEIAGSFVHASDGAPSGWRIESATIHSADPSLHGTNVTALVDADDAALRRAENALAYARTEWLS